MKEPSENRKYEIWSVFITAALVLFVATILCGVVLQERFSRLTRTQIGDEALHVASIAADLIDADAFVRIAPGDEGGADYHAVLQVLDRIRIASGVEYLYTVAYDASGDMVFVVDSDPVEPGLAGEAYIGAASAEAALSGYAAADESPYTDRWGTHLSASAPVWRNGKVIGAVVVDVGYTLVLDEIRATSGLVVIWCVVFFLMSVALLLYVTRRTNQYLTRIGEAERIAEESDRAMRAFYTQMPDAKGAPRMPDAKGAPQTAGATETKADAGLRGRYAESGVLQYDEAIRLLGTEELLTATAKQFYEDIAANADEIERLHKAGDLENYTVKVHALKSSARLIGAEQLSLQAKRLEEMGNRAEGNAD